MGAMFPAVHLGTGPQGWQLWVSATPLLAV